MRGRTNVMQRTGATVNGDVVNAVVSGGNVATGDFVQWEKIPTDTEFNSEVSHMLNTITSPQVSFNNRFEHMYDNVYMLMLSDLSILVNVAGGDVEILDTFTGFGTFCKVSDTKMLFYGNGGAQLKFYLTDLSQGRFNALSSAASRIGGSSSSDQLRAICKLAPHKYIAFGNNLSSNRLYANIVVLNNDDTEITTIYRVSAELGYVGSEHLYRLSTQTEDAYMSEKIEEGFYCADYKVGIMTNYARYAILTVDNSISGDVNDNTGTMFIINNLTYGLGRTALPISSAGKTTHMNPNANLRPAKNNSGTKGLIAGYWVSGTTYYPNFSIMEYVSNALVERTASDYTDIANLFSSAAGTMEMCSLSQVKDNVFYICFGSTSSSSAYKNYLGFVRIEWDPILRSFSKSNFVVSTLSKQQGFGCFAEDEDGNVVYLYRHYNGNSAYDSIHTYRLTYKNGLLAVGSDTNKVQPISGNVKNAIGFAKLGANVGQTAQIYVPHV